MTHIQRLIDIWCEYYREIPEEKRAFPEKDAEIGLKLEHTWCGFDSNDVAIFYFLRAVEKGNSLAMVLLGDLFRDENDYESAYYWYWEAMLCNNSIHLEAIFQIASFYYNGNYVIRDYEKALYYFQIAEDFGHLSAPYWIGELYEKGYSGKIDMVKAEYHYQIGASYLDKRCINALKRLERKKKALNNE